VEIRETRSGKSVSRLELGKADEEREEITGSGIRS
jgi:hypothetical protein